jgi:exoribonuclease R
MAFCYFKKHTHTGLTGVLKNGSVNSTLITDVNRAFEGDEIFYQPDGICTGIQKRKRVKIVGVLKLTNLKKYGKTKRGLPIYKMTPLSWRYPDMYVASSQRDLSENIYVLVEFKEWTEYQKYPTATLCTILNKCSDAKAEDMALLYKSEIYRKALPDHAIPDRDRDETRVEFSLDAGVTCIDPAGSNDLDDAFHIRAHRLYVHIADVDYYIRERDPLNGDIKKRSVSIYGTELSHMLPERLSTDIISLKPNGRKAVLTVEFTFNPNSGVLLPVKCYPAFISVARALTYDRAQELLATDEMLQAASRFTDTTDTHKIIEKLMIGTNAFIGRMLFENGAGGLIRTCTIGEPAVYRPIVPGDPIRHETLEIDYYTHFTSPIRRYADIIVHRRVKAILESGTDPRNHLVEALVEDCGYLNTYAEKTRQYYHDLTILKLYRYVNSQGGLVHRKGVFRGYLVPSNKVRLFFPDLELEYAYELCDARLNFDIAVDETGNLSVNGQVFTLESLVPVTLRTQVLEIKLNRKVVMHIL